MDEFVENICKLQCKYYRKTTQCCCQTSWNYCIPRLIFEAQKEKAHANN